VRETGTATATACLRDVVLDLDAGQRGTAEEGASIRQDVGGLFFLRWFSVAASVGDSASENQRRCEAERVEEFVHSCANGLLNRDGIVLVVDQPVGVEIQASTKWTAGRVLTKTGPADRSRILATIDCRRSRNRENEIGVVDAGGDVGSGEGVVTTRSACGLQRSRELSDLDGVRDDGDRFREESVEKKITLRIGQHVVSTARVSTRRSLHVGAGARRSRTVLRCVVQIDGANHDADATYSEGDTFTLLDKRGLVGVFDTEYLIASLLDLDLRDDVRVLNTIMLEIVPLSNCFRDVTVGVFVELFSFGGDCAEMFVNEVLIVVVMMMSVVTVSGDTQSEATAKKKKGCEQR
jgi:hypothetical protein